ncbi:MAG: hypothetical protein HY000_29355 [Planctomycetes bacterium]|nr:hypothetical protein [Planctomycetota bacterium]
MSDWIEIIPCIQGRITADGKLSEPDIYWILDRWFERHPEMLPRRKDMRISRARTRVGAFPTELVRVTIIAADDIREYNPAQDRDLYDRFLADE